MSQHVVTRTKSFPTVTALGAHIRVRLDASGYLVAAGAADTDCIGVTEIASNPGSGINPTPQWIPVALRTAQGTFQMKAGGTFTAPVAVYAAAAGEIDDSGTVLVGLALESATAAHDIVEVLDSPAAILGDIARTALTQDDLQEYALPVTGARIWDAPSTVAPAAGTSDDLGVYDNTFLTGAPTIETGDLKNTTTTRKTRLMFTVPPEYVPGETIKLRANAGMKTTVASASTTIDFQVVRQAAPTVDVCATGAQSINSLVAADKDFTITPTDVVPGDVLDLVCVVTVTDSATGTAVIGQINSIKLLLDIQG